MKQISGDSAWYFLEEKDLLFTDFSHSDYKLVSSQSDLILAFLNKGVQAKNELEVFIIEDYVVNYQGLVLLQQLLNEKMELYPDQTHFEKANTELSNYIFDVNPMHLFFDAH